MTARWNVCLWLVTLGLLSGCAARRGLDDGTLTADGIHRRTGYSLHLEGTAAETMLPSGVSLDRPLSADDTAAIALLNNAQLRADLATLGIARGDLIDAGLLRSPRLDVLFPVGIKPLELLFDFPVEALWERPRRVAAAQQAYDQLAHSLIQNGLDTIRNVRLAHYDLLQAQRRLATAKEAADLRQRIFTLMNVRLQVGDVSELETIAARSEAGTTQEQLVRMEHDVDLASQRLCLAMGLSIGHEVLQVVEDTSVPPIPDPVDALIEIAIAARPDLRAAR